MVRLLRSHTAATPSARAVTVSLAIVAVLGGAFGVGFLAGRHDGHDAAVATVPLVGTVAAPAAAGSLRIGAPDPSGNRTLLLTVRGLPALRSNEYYDLYLRRPGRRPATWVGVFTTSAGAASVRFNDVADPRSGIGWEVVVRARGRHRVERVVLRSRSAPSGRRTQREGGTNG